MQTAGKDLLKVDTVEKEKVEDFILCINLGLPCHKWSTCID